MTRYSRIWLLVINLLLLGAVLAILLRLYPALPDNKDVLWIEFAVMAGFNLFLLGMLPLIPWLRNHPDSFAWRRRLGTYPSSLQDSFWKTSAETALLLCQSLNLFFALLIRGTLLRLMGRPESLGWIFMLMVIPLLAITILWIIRLIRMLKQRQQDIGPK